MLLEGYYIKVYQSYCVTVTFKKNKTKLFFDLQLVNSNKASYNIC